MVRLRLTEQQLEELIDAVHAALASIRMEIDDADNQEYRVMLEQRWQILAGVLERMRRAREMSVSL